MPILQPQHSAPSDQSIPNNVRRVSIRGAVTRRGWRYRSHLRVFRNSRVLSMMHYSHEPPRLKGNSGMVIDFELFGQRFQAINGGPEFPFTEAISLRVDCDNQVEVDALWSALIAEVGSPSQCGWLMDKFGPSRLALR